MMKTYFLFAIFLLQFFAMPCMAKDVVAGDSVLVWGNVIDSYSYNCMTGVRVELVSAADSKVLAVDSTYDYTLKHNEELRRIVSRQDEQLGFILFKMRVLPGVYRLRFSCKGFAPQERTLHVLAKQRGRKLKNMRVGNIVMQRMAERELGEAVVTASKVMMVEKGDTTVFNAAYFQLAYGQMLNKLFLMIPGLEIKSGGRIFYQGNPLKTLLVDGRRFFNGDVNTALFHLPAYAVNTINIYHREEEDAYLQVRKEQTDSTPNTIDIRLKKLVDRGWIFNAELGGGPALGSGDAWGNARYLSRLYASCFTDRTSFSLVGNYNNVNDAKTAYSLGEWDDVWEPEKGVTELLYGGMTFNTESYDRSLTFDADARVTHETTHLQSITSTTSTFPTGDVFNRSSLQRDNNRHHLSFVSHLTKSFKKAFLKIPLEVEHWNYHISDLNLSAQFKGDPKDSYGAASLDSIFVGPQSNRLQALLVNQLEQHSYSKIKELTVNFEPYFSYRIPGLDMNWMNTFSFNYKRGQAQKYEHYNLKNAQTAQDNNMNRYFEEPSHGFNFEYNTILNFGETFRNPILRKLFKSVSYRYSREHTSGSRDLFNLHHLQQEEVPQKLGSLPSVDNWREWAIDLNNSYHQKKTTDSHKVCANIEWDKIGKNGNLTIAPALVFHHQLFEDTRYAQQVNKRNAFFVASVRYVKQDVHNNLSLENGDKGKKQYWFNVDYDYVRTPPSANYLALVRDDSDPLHVSLGNPLLRPSSKHVLVGKYAQGRFGVDDVYVSFGLTKRNDDVAMGCTYDSETGVYTFRPENVNGNWNCMLGTGYSRIFGAKGRWDASTATTWRYLHLVDLLNEELSTVRNHLLSETLSLKAHFGKVVTVSLRGNLDWSHATSERENYRTRNTFDLFYGPDISLHLLGDLSLGTNFNVYKRYGYDDHSMNDRNLVWNASLSWSFDFRKSSYWGYHTVEYLKVRQRGGTGARPWTFRITCHDLLQQLGNFRRVVDAQGITETRYNAVPSYVMFCLSYRFSKMPKKRP